MLGAFKQGTRVRGSLAHRSTGFSQKWIPSRCPSRHASRVGRMRSGSESTTQMPKRELDGLVDDAIVWAAQNGLVYGLGDDNLPVAMVHAPLSLLPCTFPRKTFEQAKELMTLFNDLVDRVAADEEYLKTTLVATGKEDPFTGKLLELLEATKEARAARKDSEIALGVHRSDYMLNAANQQLLQVELNTIAASFACLSTLMTRLHRYVYGRMATPLDVGSLPDNYALDSIVEGLAVSARAEGTPGGVVLMVVQPGERNAYDQQWLQTTLWTKHGIRTVRKTMAEIQEQGSIGPQGELIVDGWTASVVYFRAGYTPVDYYTEVEWEARKLVELSRAAKCPTVTYQLAGAKKVQQDLAAPGQLEKFCTPEEAARLRTFFAGLWSLDDPSDPASQQIIQQAISDPDSFVMKPMREGGGNNYYGPELAARLQEGTGLAAYILMERIKPAPQTSILVRNGEWREEQTLSELGVYGVYVKQGPRVLMNKEAGHLVRTKTASSNEGGVAAGFAVLDSPRLV